MATRVNRAATAANKTGGKQGRRNNTVARIRPDHSLDSTANQEAFGQGRRETDARHRNRTMGDPTEPTASGASATRPVTT
jgi:hypothetical protein